MPVVSQPGSRWIPSTSNHIPVAARRSKITELISPFFVLQFFKGLGFNLSDSFSGDPHHFTDFFQRERPKVTGNPCTIEKGLISQTPLTDGILADFGDRTALLAAFINMVQGLGLLWWTSFFLKYGCSAYLSILKQDEAPDTDSADNAYPERSITDSLAVLSRIRSGAVTYGHPMDDLSAAVHRGWYAPSQQMATPRQRFPDFRTEARLQ